MNTRTTHLLRFAGAAALAGFLVVTLGASAPSAPAQDGGGEGPHFYSGVTVDVSGPVDGDVYATGQSVTVSGDVTGDVIAAAQTITISGRVDGNVRLAAQNVTITGDVARSGTIFAADLLVESQGAVENDIVATANSIRVAGDVGRDLLVSVTDLRIDGTVGGDVTYASARTAHIADGAVSGSVEHVQTQQGSRVEISPWAAVLGWFLGVLYALVALSLLTVVAGLLVPRTLLRVTDQLLPSPWRALLVGFVASIAVPIALVFLLVTIVGAPLALAGLLVWIVLTLATFLVGAHYLGRVVLRGSPHPVLQSFVGGLILIVGLQIPLLNILVWLAMVFFGLGAELLELYRQRPWNVGATTPAASPATAPPQQAQPVVANEPPRQ
jgi:cytoskeletal protein CcmA (bactofilin family)